MGKHTTRRTSATAREIRGVGLYWGLIAALLVAVAILIGVIQNSQDVELRFLGWSGRVPLLVILLATVVLVVILDEALGLAWRRRRRRHITQRAELQELRERPAPSPPTPPPAEESAPPPTAP
jgi:uncharacterized integral membrane protein